MAKHSEEVTTKNNSANPEVAGKPSNDTTKNEKLDNAPQDDQRPQDASTSSKAPVVAPKGVAKGSVTRTKKRSTA